MDFDKLKLAVEKLGQKWDKFDPETQCDIQEAFRNISDCVCEEEDLMDLFTDGVDF